MTEEIKKKRGRPKGSRNKKSIQKEIEIRERAEALKNRKPVIPDRPHGQILEHMNLCANCEGTLKSVKDGHWHSRSSRVYNGAEVICCKCAKHA